MNGKISVPAIHLNIEHLVLHGMAHIDPATLTLALQEALSREMNSTQTLYAADRPLARATLSLPAQCGTQQLADTVARTIAGIVADGDASAAHGCVKGSP